MVSGKCCDIEKAGKNWTIFILGNIMIMFVFFYNFPAPMTMFVFFITSQEQYGTDS